MTGRLVACRVEPITPKLPGVLITTREVRRINCLGSLFLLESINRRDGNDAGCSMGLRGEGVPASMSSGRTELGDIDTEKGKQEGGRCGELETGS